MMALLPALLGALAIGLSLGLLGSGGSILTVPVLVYLLGQEEKVAIAGSLAVVGTIALAGAIPYVRQRLVDWRNVLWFGAPGMLGTVGGAWLAQWISGLAQLALFALVMLLAAWFMFRPPALRPADAAPRARWRIVADGIVVGIVTGLVGVGGGFLIIPALVLLGGLGMRLAVGTSLVIIALKSFSGFAKYLDVLAGQGLALDWAVLALVSVFGVAGSYAGNLIGGRVPADLLRRGFAVFLVVMALYILANSLPGLLR